MKMFIFPIEQYVEGFVVTGFCVRTKNQDELKLETAKLPKLWQQFYNSNLTTKGNIFGVYSNYESDVNGYYTATVGVDNSTVQAKLKTVSIHAGTYLVFEGEGPMPFIVAETWKHVWEFFEKNLQYKRSYISDFEAYSNTNKVEIFIGIK